MAASIAEYLLGLARDPQAAARHNASPEAARDMMSQAGLSAEQQAVVASGDAQNITSAVQSELQLPAAGGVQYMMVFCIFAPPHNS